MFKTKNFASVCLLAVLTACSSKSDSGPGQKPKEVLSDYVNKSFSIKSPAEKSELVQLTTGTVQETLKNLSDETVKATMIAPVRKLKSLKIRDERKIGENKFSITYEVSYDVGSGETLDSVTNKKHAIFNRVEGNWRISEVRNLKTYIEHQNELTF